MNLLPDPGDDGKVLGEVCGEDSGDPVRIQIFKLAQLWKMLQNDKIIKKNIFLYITIPI